MSLPCFYASLNDGTYPHIKCLARKVLFLSGSTCVWQQAFSRMKFIKTKSRSALTDEPLAQLMWIATSTREPDFGKLILKKALINV